MLEDTTDPKQKPRVRSGRPKRVVTEAGVGVKRLGETTLVLQAGETKPLRLKSVARSVQHKRRVVERYAQGAPEIKEANRIWKEKRCRQRVLITRATSPLLLVERYR